MENKQTPGKPVTYKERVMEAGIKTVEKRTKDKVNKRLDAKEDPKEILKDLMASVDGKPSQQQSQQQQQGQDDILQQLLKISQTQIPSGERMGLGRSVMSGHGFDRPEYTEPLGIGPAMQVLNLQRSIQKEKGALTAKEAETRIAAKKEVLKTNETQRVAMGNVISMFSNIVSQVKGAEEEQGGLGLQQGAKGLLGVITRNPEYSRTSAAYGQRVETALRMNRILTGQNRVIRSVVDMVLNSLPDRFDPEETVAAKIAQSVKNSYMISKAWEKAAMTPVEIKALPTTKMTIGGKEVEIIDIDIPIQKLSNREEKELESITQEILATPAAKARKLGRQKAKQPVGNSFKSEEEAERANLKPGTRITINGRAAIWE